MGFGTTTPVGRVAASSEGPRTRSASPPRLRTLVSSVLAFTAASAGTTAYQSTNGEEGQSVAGSSVASPSRRMRRHSSPRINQLYSAGIDKQRARAAVEPMIDMSQCTFSPSTNRSKGPLSSAAPEVPPTPDAMYERSRSWLSNRDIKLAAKRAVVASGAEELSQCTFSPRLNPSTALATSRIGLPRPRSRSNSVGGTSGLWDGTPRWDGAGDSWNDGAASVRSRSDASSMGASGSTVSKPGVLRFVQRCEAARAQAAQRSTIPGKDGSGWTGTPTRHAEFSFARRVAAPVASLRRPAGALDLAALASPVTSDRGGLGGGVSPSSPTKASASTFRVPMLDPPFASMRG